MASRTFRFSVDAQGKFTYEHPNPPVDGDPNAKNWAYTHRDTLDFVCSQGPFVVKLRRTDMAGLGGAKDPFGPVHAEKKGNQWVAHVDVINDGLDPVVRKTIWEAAGFISKYRYVIGVADGDGAVHVDDSHTGIHTC